LGEELPTTGIVNTGGGGAHFYFKHPGFTVRSRSPGFGAEYPGLDIKGDGGYAIAPPSNHVSGNKYTWEHEDELAEIPDRLLALIKEEEHRPAPITVEVSRISEGRRHNSLLAFAAAYHRQGWTEKPLDKNCWLTMKLSATHHWVKER
jgi:hypothetical protein